MPSDRTHAELLAALKALVADIDAATPALDQACACSRVHGVPYKGPLIDVGAARAAIAKHEGRS